MKSYTFLSTIFLLFALLANTVSFGQVTSVKTAPEGGFMVYFKSGSAILDATSKKAIDAALNTSKEGENISLEIFGHTDNTGNDEANIALSRKRGYAIWDYVMAKRKYDVKHGDIFMNGEFVPTIDNESEANRAKNRRVYVVIKKI